ncbi:MAG: hypothetical protein VKL39_10975 [Leptolyngbyaceae bacterium]|nr:hypothetical protein [Leptolyngbyaceae bacterium]
MMTRNHWQAKTALGLVVGMVTAIATPIAVQGRSLEWTNAERQSGRYIAQTLFDSAQIVIPEGTRIQVGYDDTNDEGEPIERILLDPDETAEVTLTVDQPIRSNRGTVLIPAGSEIEGELRPLEGDTPGTQFFAETLRLPNGETADLDAVSAPVTRTEVITEETDPDFIKGAVIGAAAAAVLAEIFGSINILEVLGGGALGALGIWIFGGGEEETEVVVVEPDNDLDLTLQSELRL